MSHSCHGFRVAALLSLLALHPAVRPSHLAGDSGQDQGRAECKIRVLIAFGSKRGGTAGLADMIGDALREPGSTLWSARPAAFTTSPSSTRLSWSARCTPTGGIVTPAGSSADTLRRYASCRSGWSAVARWTTRSNTGTLHPQSKSPSWPTELAPADMSRSVAACRRMQRGFPPQRWPRPTRATGATRLTSGVGWNRSWPSSSRGRLRALKPRYEGRLRRTSIEQSVWRSILRVSGATTSVTRSGLSAPMMIG